MWGFSEHRQRVTQVASCPNSGLVPVLLPQGARGQGGLLIWLLHLTCLNLLSTCECRLPPPVLLKITKHITFSSSWEFFFYIDLWLWLKISHDNTECWWGHRETGSFTHRWWEFKMVQLLEHSLAVSLKHATTVWLSNYTSEYLFQINEDVSHTECLSSFIHNSQKLEATQMSFSG